MMEAAANNRTSNSRFIRLGGCTPRAFNLPEFKAQFWLHSPRRPICWTTSRNSLSGETLLI